MPSNCGATTLKRKRRTCNAMRDFDQLPPQLRRWMAKADLPWRAQSVRAAYEKALRKTGCEAQAIRSLDQLQARLVTKDATRIWGADYPAAK